MKLVPRTSVVLALLAAAPVAQTQLSAPLPRETTGTVAPFAQSPDGSRFAYVSDERADEAFELWGVPADASSAPLLLAGAVVPGGDVLNTPGALALTADGNTAVFLADRDQDDVVELYRVPLDGSAAPQKLSGALVAGGDVSSFRLSPDGATAVFLADAELDERHELFRVPTDASATRTRLHGALPANRDVFDYVLGPQGLGAYFRADAAIDGVLELFSAPLDASAPAVRLNDALPAGREVLEFRITADEERVVFRADGASNDVVELYSVPVDRSSAPVKLNATPVAGGDVERFDLSPDGAHVAFTADLQTDHVFGLYRAPLDGSLPAVSLLAPGSQVQALRHLPDSATIVFGGTPSGGSSGLHRVPASGGTPVLLGANLAGTDFVIEIHPDPEGQSVSYVERRTSYGPFGEYLGTVDNLLDVPLDGATPPIRLTDHVTGAFNEERIQQLTFTADGSRAVFVRSTIIGWPAVCSLLTDGSTPLQELVIGDGPFELSTDGLRVACVEEYTSQSGQLWSFELGGSGALALSPPSTPGAVYGDVSAFQPTPDGLQVVYHTSIAESLHVVGSGGGSAALPIVVDRTYGPQAASLVFSPGSERVAFIAAGLASSSAKLLSAPLRPPGPAVVVSAPVLDGERIPYLQALSPRFTPDGETLVFASGTQFFTSGDFRLYRAPVDGSALPVRLNGTGNDAVLWDADVSSSASGRAFELAPDGTRVVYAARASSGTTIELFSVPIDGSAAPLRLSRLTQVATGVYGNWELTPDGAYVVYVADQEVRGRFELYSVPIDGSALPGKLSSTPVTGGDVGTFSEGTGLIGFVRISSDGLRVAYLADQDTDDQFELYSAPVDDSAAPIKLSGVLPSDADVSSFFQLDPTGTSAFFRADSETDGVLELFTVPLDGSSAPLKLSGTLVAGGDVLATATRDGLVRFGQGRVVYAADALQDEVIELFSVPVDGSAAPVRLNAPLPSGGDVAVWLTTADGSTVLYRADQTTNDVFELWRVPLDGSSAPVRINLALPAGGDVEPDVRVIARGNRLFYRADQDVNDEFELYTLRLEPRTPRGPAVPPPISGTVTRGL